MLDHTLKTRLFLKGTNPFIGTWHITEMEAWDQDFVDLEVPGHFIFEQKGLGSFQFGAVQGEMDWRVEIGARGPRIEFSWEGVDEDEPVTGRGWVEIDDDGIQGWFFFHKGEDSAFWARKALKRKKNDNFKAF